MEIRVPAQITKNSQTIDEEVILKSDTYNFYFYPAPEGNVTTANKIYIPDLGITFNGWRDIKPFALLTASISMQG